MKKVFVSKIGTFILVPLAILLGILVIAFIQEGALLGLIPLILVILFILNMFLNTRYTLDQGMLDIRCGFLYRKVIDVARIRKISETNTLMSSPALSLDRLELHLYKASSVVISPKNKDEFIEAMLQVNDQILVQRKLKSTS